MWRQTPVVMAQIERGISPKTAVEQFLLDCRARRLSAQTVAFYRRKLAQFLRWCDANGIVDLSQMRAAAVRAFGASLSDRNLSLHYQIGIMRSLGALLKFAVADEMLSSAPAVPKPRLPRREPQAITMAQVRRLLAAATTDRDRLLLLLLLDTGVRAGEAVALNVGDLDAATGAIRVRMGKGRKDRTVYAGAKLRRALWRYMRSRGELHPDAPLIGALKPAGGRLTVSGVVQVLADVRRRTGIVVTAHTLRRTFALESLRAGMDVYSLARLMGHQDISTLRHYLALAETDLAAASARYGVGDQT